MSLPQFAYAAPRTLEEALTLLAQHRGSARVMAGGTDLLLKMERRQLAPALLIGLKRIDELRYIRFDPDQGLFIGALARLSDVVEDAIVRARYPALAAAASQTATVQIRNMGTVAGNLCNASPCADNAPTLIARGAKVELVGAQARSRWLELERFFTGPGATALAPDEILRQIHVPCPPGGSAAAYQNISARSKVDISAVSVGVHLTRRDGKCHEARIVLGAVAPVPLRAREAEAVLVGTGMDQDVMRASGEIAARESRPISDVRASSEWRREIVAVLTRRALRQAWNSIAAAHQGL